MGDFVWLGKYKNTLGQIISFQADGKGNPTITVSPIPKGRKQDKTFSLFKIWKVRPEQLAELKAKGKIASMGTMEAHSDALWQGAVTALQEFQGAVQTMKAVKPSDPRWEQTVKDHAFLPTPLAVTAVPAFADWLDASFGPGAATALDAFRPKGASLVADDPSDLKEQETLYAEFLTKLDVYQDQIQAYLNRIAPAKFAYQGFTILNPQRIGSERAIQMLDGVPFLLALFKKRGAEPLLRDGVRQIILNHKIGGDSWHGYYAETAHEIALSTRMLTGSGRVWKDWIQEVFVHEFGHYVHMTYIKGEAKEYWDQTWKPVKDLQAKLHKISPEELNRYYDLLEKDGFVPGKTVKRLKNIDKVKFAYWLRNPMLGEPLITPAQFRPTKHGQSVFESLRDPLMWVRERSSIVGLSEEENVARLIKRRKEDVFGLNYSGGIGISQTELDAIRKSDPTIDNALQGIYADLGVPSDYGKTNELEDFAENFAIFMTEPSKLSDNARYRMQRTLWLSGFGGKPVLRLAARVSERYLQAVESDDHDFDE